MLEIPRAPVSPDEISLAIGIMGPDESRLKAVTGALGEHHGLRVTEFASYPPKREDLPQKLAQTYDVLMVDADFDPEYALGIVENLCAGGQNYVMAYSSQADMKLAVRFMRAGVREFFTLPIDAMELAAALKLAVKNRDEAPPPPHRGKNQRRQAVRISGEQRRLRRHYSRGQFCACTGRGVQPSNPARRSRSAARRCGDQSRHRNRIFGCRGPAKRRSARCKVALYPRSQA